METILKAHKIRLYPTEEQAEVLTLCCDYRRNAFNWGVEQIQASREDYFRLYNNLSALGQMIGWDKDRVQKLVDEQKPAFVTDYEISKAWTEHKNNEAPELYARYKGIVPQHVGFVGIKDACTARKKAMQENAGQPQFAAKGKNERFVAARSCDISQVKFHDQRKADGGYKKRSKVELPMIPGKIETAQRVRFKGELREVTVSFRAGEWYGSFLVDTKQKPPAPRNPENIVGADVGSRTLLTTTNVTTNATKQYKNPKAQEKIKRNLARAQRKQARCQGANKGEIKSLRWKRLNKIVQRLKAKERNIRLDAIHKATTDAIANADVLVVESLTVKNLMAKGGNRKKGLNRAMSDAAMGITLTQLKYKADWNGVRLEKAGRFYPSSQLCSECGQQNRELGSQEQYRCPHCKMTMNRDVNASINLGRTFTGEGVTSPTARKKARGTMMVEPIASAQRDRTYSDGKHTGDINSVNTFSCPEGDETPRKTSSNLNGGTS